LFFPRFFLSENKQNNFLQYTHILLDVIANGNPEQQVNLLIIIDGYVYVMKIQAGCDENYREWAQSQPNRQGKIKKMQTTG
jgi:hypothetical protein